MDIQRILLTVLGVALFALPARGGGYEFDPDYLIPPKCKPCDATPCPQLTYCVGKVLKDHCGCCLRCSSDLFQPIDSDPIPSEIKENKKVEETKVDACQQRACPRFKICVLNQQGLPICTCPSIKVCNKRGKRASQLSDESICGSNGVTYASKCHLRLANCNSLKRIKKKHLGPCIKDKSVLDVEKTSDSGTRGFATGQTAGKPLSKKEEKARLRELRRAKRKERKMRKRQKNRRMRKKEKKTQKGRNRRRSKRLNTAFSPYSSHYDFLLRKHTNWSHNQIRKSRI